MSMFSFQPTAAPGREAPAAPAQPTPGTAPPEGPPPGPGTASPGGPLGGGMMPLLIMVLPILLIFMTMRGQTKKQKQVESNLKTGDTVVTQSGLIGKITELGETRVKIEIAPGVSVRMLKSAISGVDGGEQATPRRPTSRTSPRRRRPEAPWVTIGGTPVPRPAFSSQREEGATVQCSTTSSSSGSPASPASAVLGALLRRAHRGSFTAAAISAGSAAVAAHYDVFWALAVFGLGVGVGALLRDELHRPRLAGQDGLRPLPRARRGALHLPDVPRRALRPRTTSRR